MSDYVTIYTTFPTEEVATRITTKLVHEQLIACANLIAGAQSIYNWNGAVQLEREVICFLKTHKDCADAAVKLISDLHSFEAPCITVMPIESGHQGYLDWIGQATKMHHSTKEYA